MRIAYVSDYLPGYHKRAGGADWASLRIGELVSGSNISIDYYVRPPDKKETKKEGNIRYVPIVEKFLPLAITKYVEAAKWCILQIDLLSLLYFFQEFMRNRPDILHMHRFRAITMSPILVASLLKIPIYFSVYDYWMFCTLETLIDDKNHICRRFHGVWCWRCLPKRMVWLQQGLLLFRKRLFDWAMRRIDKFVVLSRSSAQILNDYGINAKKITIIPLPYGQKIRAVNTEEIPERDTLLYVGWIQKRKGLDILLRALELVKKEAPGVKLNIIGPDVLWEKAYRYSVNSLIQELSLTKNIVWLGPRANESVQSFIRRSEIIIVPEQWENMSPVIVGEAMFNQRPVIGSRLGGIPDFVSDNKTGLLFEASSPSDLAEKILYLLKNKNIAIQMGKSARGLAEEIFSEDKIRERYLNLYSK